MTDKQLYELCQKYGSEARKWKNKFVSLLPEVYKRKLYKKKFHSIYEFAAKVGGVSKNVVDEVLRLDVKFEGMPKLKSMIAEVGVSKVKIVAGFATIETDAFFAEKVNTMTRKCLATYIKDIKKINGGTFGGSEGMKNPEKIPGESDGQNADLPLEEVMNRTSENQNLMTQNKNKSTFRMNLSEDAIFKLRLIKQKLEKEQKEVLCWDEVVNLVAEKLLKEEPKREYKARESKSRAIPAKKRREQPKSRQVPAKKRREQPKSRQVPAKKRREQPKQCISPGCKSPAEVIHHPERWALSKSHNDLVSLCKSHHELAHRGYLEEQNDFKTLLKPIIDPIKAAIDQKMLGYLKSSS